MEFEVVGITKKAKDQWQVLLEGKFHVIFTSQIYLNLATKEEAADYPLGTKLSLDWAPTALPEPIGSTS